PRLVAATLDRALGDLLRALGIAGDQTLFSCIQRLTRRTNRRPYQIGRTLLGERYFTRSLLFAPKRQIQVRQHRAKRVLESDFTLLKVGKLIVEIMSEHEALLHGVVHLARANRLDPLVALFAIFIGVVGHRGFAD